MTEVTPAEYTPRVALVTGAAGSVGSAIALRLAHDGFDIAANDINKDGLDRLMQELSATGRKVIPILADVSVEKEVQSMVQLAVLELGSLDVMITNARISYPKSFLLADVEKFDKVMAVNVRGTMLCYKHAGLQMIHQGRGGRIIGASSVLGKQGCRMLSAYVASKFAVRGLTQSLSEELWPYKITVNAYAPGIVETKDQVSIMKLKELMHLPPDAPQGTPEDVASLVSYLCKPESHFITGQSINVNGGIFME